MQALSDTAFSFANWLESEAGITGARIGRTLEGGNSNVTSLVDTPDGPLVLRHPPADTISPRASAGIEREFRFLSALSGKAPVPEPITYCKDSSVLGMPFSVMRFVAGETITDTLPPAYDHSVATIDAIGHSLIDALAQVHAISPVPAYLGDEQKARSFVSRQIKRWREERRKRAVRDLPLIDELASWLLANVPVPEAVRIVHCDYHLDNVLMDPRKPTVAAILDWEMGTLADPLVDVGLVTAMWNRDERQARGFAFVQGVSNVPGAIDANGLARRWSEKTGLSIERLGYFQAFALWRLAAIVEGAYVLYRKGHVDGAYERGLEHDVPALLDEAERFALDEGKR